MRSYVSYIVKIFIVTYSVLVRYFSAYSIPRLAFGRKAIPWLDSGFEIVYLLQVLGYSIKPLMR